MRKDKRLRKKQAEPGPSPKRIVRRQEEKDQQPLGPVDRPSRNVSGDIPVVPSGFKWKGTKDNHPQHKNRVRVEPGCMPAGFPKFAKEVPPGTLWVMDRGDNEYVQLVTVMPDGVNVAWSHCSRCLNIAFRCSCAAGILHPRSIEWIYIKALMRNDGLDTDLRDATHYHVTERGTFYYRSRQTSRNRPVGGFRTRSGVEGRQTPEKPPERRAGAQNDARKRLRKAAVSGTASGPAVTSEPVPVDLSALNKTASSRSQELEAQFDRVLAGAGTDKNAGTTRPVKRLRKRK